MWINLLMNYLLNKVNELRVITNLLYCEVTKIINNKNTPKKFFR